MVRGSEVRKQTFPIASISLGLINVLHEAATEPQCHDDEHDNKDAGHALGRLACGLRAVNAHLIHPIRSGPDERLHLRPGSGFESGSHGFRLLRPFCVQKFEGSRKPIKIQV